MYDVIFIDQNTMFPDGDALQLPSTATSDGDRSNVITPLRHMQWMADSFSDGWRDLPEDERRPILTWRDRVFVQAHLGQTASGPNGQSGYYLTGYDDVKNIHDAKQSAQWTELDEGVFGGVFDHATD